jgi:hypothetical protein
VRLSEDEPASSVLKRLYAQEPVWKPHPKTGKHPAALGLSASHESRATFEARHAAWADAVERELARQRADKEGEG